MTAAEWETTNEVALRTRRHRVTILRAAESGVLHGHQTGKGGRWTFKPAAVDAWVEGRNSKAACGCQALRLAKRRAA
jgi:excisionase family DNA binding protein